MRSEQPRSGPHWTTVTGNNDFGDAVRRARVAPRGAFPITLVELRGTGSRKRVRLVSDPEWGGIEATPPSGVLARRSWFPDGELWEVSRVAVVHRPPSASPETSTSAARSP
jgi:hypothetical protein